MNIKFLQSLDFLIQQAKTFYPFEKEWNISFQWNGELYTADFISQIDNENAIVSDFKSNNIVKVPLMSYDSYNMLYDKNASSESPVYELSRCLESGKPFDAYRLLNHYAKKFQIDTSKLDNFAFNVKNLKTGVTFPFIEFSIFSKIEFVTLLTDEELNNVYKNS